MNTDQIKGKTKEIAGNIQKNVGQAVGSTETEVNGKLRETEGQVQKRVGDVREAVEDRADDLGPNP